jgi:CRP-like cAMP-binding protein
VIEELRQNHLFSGLGEAELNRVAQHAKILKLKSGEALFEQGDLAKRFYLVRNGQIKLFRLSPAGNEKIVDIVTPGNTFAEALMFFERPYYPVAAQALQTSEVISIDAVDFSRMLKESVESCFVLLGSLSQRLRALLHDIDELSLHSGTSRVAAYFLEHDPGDVVTYSLPAPKQVIASRLSVKPETFSRIIKNLSNEGMIKIDGNQVTIIDRHKLEMAADPDPI